MLKSLIRIPSPGSSSFAFMKCEKLSSTNFCHSKQNSKLGCNDSTSRCHPSSFSLSSSFSDGPPILNSIAHKSNCGCCSCSIRSGFSISPPTRTYQLPILQAYYSAVLGNHLTQPSTATTTRSYSTNTLFRLNETNAGQLQPVLDIENIFRNEAQFQDSVSKRKLDRKAVCTTRELYAKALEAKQTRDKIQQERDENTNKVQELVRSQKDVQIKTGEIKALKEKGRKLREQLRESEAKFNQVNDELVDYVLSLPNLVDSETPDTEAVLLSETPVPDKIKKWEFPVYYAIESPVGPGLLAEFPVGKSAWLDVQLREKAQTHLLKGGFVETGNAEYVKRVILAGAGIDHTQLLRIREPNVKKGWEHATYLAGGASFPSFLALFAQSVIDSSECLPLRYFVIGRSYNSHTDRPGSYQSHNVQAFVACKNEEEMGEEFKKLQGLMESFYSTQVGFQFQTQVVPASRLKMYEKKKLAFVMNATDKSPSKMVGTLSTVGDYVSKRLLCCYSDDKKQTQFLHLISAQFFNITHFLRSQTNKKIVDHTGAPVLDEISVLSAVNEMKTEEGILGEQHQPNNNSKNL